MESGGNISLELRSGGVSFIEDGIGTKIPSEYFAGTGIGTGFCRVGDDRNRGEKIRSPRTLVPGSQKNWGGRSMIFSRTNEQKTQNCGGWGRRFFKNLCQISTKKEQNFRTLVGPPLVGTRARRVRVEISRLLLMKFGSGFGSLKKFNRPGPGPKNFNQSNPGSGPEIPRPVGL